MENEILKDIVGYEGLYKISSYGRVFSVKRNKFLKPRKDTCGYLQVGLCKSGKHKFCLLHRLVATAFIPNPLQLPQVNHKDENPSNNRIENLEWCDASYNNRYGSRTEKYSKKVLQFTKQGEFVNEYPSLVEASRKTKINLGNISSCCNGREGYSHAGGFVWRYKDAS